MRKELICRWKLLFLGILVCCIGISTKAYAGTVYTNPDTGFYIILEDDADLLTDAECLDRSHEYPPFYPDMLLSLSACHQPPT